jgi:isocitrate/isopropylmalate dehydrogenase
MMLEHLDLSDASQRLVAAIEEIYEDGKVLTPDQGGSATSEQFCDAVIARL